MEKAIWKKKTGEEVYIHIKDVKTELGEEKARKEKYYCPNIKCGVKVIPVFPKKLKRNSNETHSDHFRASPKKHETNCKKDGARIAANDSSGGGLGRDKPLYDVVERGPYPMRYVRRQRSRQGKPDELKGVDHEELGPGDKRKERTGPRGDHHTSKPGVGHIREIVEAYENPPEDLYRMELIMPGCPARNYADVFVDVEALMIDEARLKAAYVYKGPYRKHYVSRSGIVILFDCFSANGKELGVWVDYALEQDANRAEILDLLRQAERDQNATVYVFGRFKPHRDTKYSVEVEAFGDLWITFPVPRTYAFSPRN
jgi:hypothetical protein